MPPRRPPTVPRLRLLQTPAPTTTRPPPRGPLPNRCPSVVGHDLILRSCVIAKQYPDPVPIRNASHVHEKPGAPGGRCPGPRWSDRSNGRGLSSFVGLDDLQRFLRDDHARRPHAPRSGRRCRIGFGHGYRYRSRLDEARRPNRQGASSIRLGNASIGRGGAGLDCTMRSGATGSGTATGAAKRSMGSGATGAAAATGATSRSNSTGAMRRDGSMACTGGVGTSVSERSGCPASSASAMGP